MTTSSVFHHADLGVVQLVAAVRALEPAPSDDPRYIELVVANIWAGTAFVDPDPAPEGDEAEADIVALLDPQIAEFLANEFRRAEKRSAVRAWLSRRAAGDQRLFEALYGLGLSLREAARELGRSHQALAMAHAQLLADARAAFTQ